MSFLVPAAAENDDIWTTAAGRVQRRRVGWAFSTAAMALCSLTYAAGYIASQATSFATSAHASAYLIGLAGTVAAPVVALALLAVTGLCLLRIAQTRRLDRSHLPDDPRVSRKVMQIAESLRNGNFQARI